jgi:NMD protein affecting ribosome stability and mRNA decay
MSENDAVRLVDFLKSRYPTSIKVSSKLISHNERENTSNLKITYSCSIPKICKDDIVHIPRKMAK